MEMISESPMEEILTRIISDRRYKNLKNDAKKSQILKDAVSRIRSKVFKQWQAGHKEVTDEVRRSLERDALSFKGEIEVRNVYSKHMPWQEDIIE